MDTPERHLARRRAHVHDRLFIMIINVVRPDPAPELRHCGRLRSGAAGATEHHDDDDE